MSAVRALTLADVAVPRAGLVTNTVLVVGASLLTALAAQIQIPLAGSPVPITGQTFAVLLCGAVLGPVRGFLAQALYIVEGAFGMPVFAGGAAGAIKLVGPTGGYLMAFPFAAALTGWLARRGWDRGFVTMLAALLLGSVIIFASGVAWLSRFMPLSHAVTTGFLPFLPGDLIKSTLAALAFPSAWAWVRRNGPNV